MEELKAALQAVGVMGWLQGQFPNLTETEILMTVNGNFEDLLGDFIKRRTPPGQQPSGVQQPMESWDTTYG